MDNIDKAASVAKMEIAVMAAVAEHKLDLFSPIYTGPMSCIYSDAVMAGYKFESFPRSIDEPLLVKEIADSILKIDEEWFGEGRKEAYEDDRRKRICAEIELYGCDANPNSMA